jgi:hypothetical protein
MAMCSGVFRGRWHSHGRLANVHNSNGKVRSVRLLETAATCVQRVGEPGGRCTGVRFTRREVLEESGNRIWQHYPRSWHYE